MLERTFRAVDSGLMVHAWLGILWVLFHDLVEVSQGCQSEGSMLRPAQSATTQRGVRLATINHRSFRLTARIWYGAVYTGSQNDLCTRRPIFPHHSQRQLVYPSGRSCLCCRTAGTARSRPCSGGRGTSISRSWIGRARHYTAGKLVAQSPSRSRLLLFSCPRISPRTACGDE